MDLLLRVRLGLPNCSFRQKLSPVLKNTLFLRTQTKNNEIAFAIP